MYNMTASPTHKQEERTIVTDTIDSTTEINPLQLELDDLKVRYENLQEVHRKYSQDLDTIGTMLKEEAERRDWCNDYNEFVDEVNAATHYPHLESFSKDYSVEVVLTFSGSARSEPSTYAIECAVNDIVKQQMFTIDEDGLIEYQYCSVSVDEQ